MSEYKLTPEENERVFRREILQDQLRRQGDPQPSSGPKVVFTGGQPGSGKSTMTPDIKKDFPENEGVLEVNTDNLRGYHPDFQEIHRKHGPEASTHTHPDASEWKFKLAYAAAGRGLNTVVDGTMTEPGEIRRVAQAFKERGYEVEIRAMAVDPRESWQGVHRRYEEQALQGDTPRMVMREKHDRGVEKMPEAIATLEQEKIPDRIMIYARNEAGSHGAHAIYDNAQKNGRWRDPPRAREAIEEHRQKPRRRSRNERVSTKGARPPARRFRKFATKSAHGSRTKSATAIDVSALVEDPRRPDRSREGRSGAVSRSQTLKARSFLQFL